jgi:hypothetical protein
VEVGGSNPLSPTRMITMGQLNSGCPFFVRRGRSIRAKWRAGLQARPSFTPVVRDVVARKARPPRRCYGLWKYAPCPQEMLVPVLFAELVFPYESPGARTVDEPTMVHIDTHMRSASFIDFEEQKVSLT